MTETEDRKLIERDVSGETFMGMRVAAWREPIRCPPDEDPEKFEEMFRLGKPNTYAEHWSTLREGAERLFTETDVRALADRLEALQPSEPGAWRHGGDELLKCVRYFRDARTIGEQAGRGEELARKVEIALTQPAKVGREEIAAWLPIEAHDGSDESVIGICATAYTPTPFETWFFDGAWRHYCRPEEKQSSGVMKWFPTHWMPKGPLAALLTGEG